MSGRRRLAIISLLIGLAAGVLIVVGYKAQRVPTQKQLFAEAFEIGKSARERNYILSEIAKAQARAGTYDDALATMSVINRFPGESVAEIVRIRIRNHDLEGARKMLSRLPSGNANNPARRDVGMAQAASGDLDGALETTNGRFASELKDALANAQLDAGNYEAALLTITQRGSPDERHDDVLYGIARQLMKHGDDRRARQVIDRIHDPEIKSAAMPTAFESALAAHNLDEARIQASRLPLRERCDALLDLAKQFVEAGRSNDASTALTEAVSAAQQLNDLSQRARALERIAVLQIDSGLSADAVPLLTKLPPNLCPIAWAYARKRKFEQANELANNECAAVAGEYYKAGDIDGSIARIRLEPNALDQSRGFAELAELAAKRGDVTNARRFADLVTARAAREGGERYLAPALREVARAWAKTGDTPQVYRWARSRPTPYQRALALLGFAEAVQ